MINHGVGEPVGWDAYFAMLFEKKHMIGGSALGEGVAVKGDVFGEVVSPTITGYILIRAESLEAAQEIARQSPVHRAGGTVEVFALVKS